MVEFTGKPDGLNAELTILFYALFTLAAVLAAAIADSKVLLRTAIIHLIVWVCTIYFHLTSFNAIPDVYVIFSLSVVTMIYLFSMTLNPNLGGKYFLYGLICLYLVEIGFSTLMFSGVAFLKMENFPRWIYIAGINRIYDIQLLYIISAALIRRFSRRNKALWSARGNAFIDRLEKIKLQFWRKH